MEMPSELPKIIKQLVRILRKELDSAQTQQQDLARTIYLSLHALGYITRLEDNTGWKFTRKGKFLTKRKSLSGLAEEVLSDIEDKEAGEVWSAAKADAFAAKDRQKRRVKSLSEEEKKKKEKKRIAKGVGRVFWKDDYSMPASEIITQREAHSRKKAGKMTSAEKIIMEQLKRRQEIGPVLSRHSNQAKQQSKKEPELETISPRTAAEKILELRDRSKNDAPNPRRKSKRSK